MAHECSFKEFAKVRVNNEKYRLLYKKITPIWGKPI